MVKYNILFLKYKKYISTEQLYIYNQSILLKNLDQYYSLTMKKENEKQSDVDMKKAQHSEQTANTTTLFSQSGIPPPTQVNNVNRWS
jgi:hypothetical protein